MSGTAETVQARPEESEGLRRRATEGEQVAPETVQRTSDEKSEQVSYV